MFDYSPYSGDPDIPSAQSGGGPLCSTTESSSYAPTGGSVTAGVWEGGPTECGPYSKAAPAATATISMSAVTKAFDTSVSTPQGDLWQLSTNPSIAFKPITIDPGKSATITVTITPNGSAGSLVSGHLYVDDAVSAVPPYSQLAGDELSAIPYEYTGG